MPHKPKPHPDDPQQFKRFIDMAREVRATGGDPEQFDRILDKVASKPRERARAIKKTPRSKRSRGQGESER
jgi:hypothetical protein